MAKEIRIVVGPHSHGLTLQLSDEVTVYIGLPPPRGATSMSDEELEANARRSAVRALKLALLELVDE